MDRMPNIVPRREEENGNEKIKISHQTTPISHQPRSLFPSLSLSIPHLFLLSPPPLLSLLPTPQLSFTIVFAAGIVGRPFRVDPRLHAHEVGDEGRDLALDDGRVALYDMLVVGLDLVRLRHHWRSGEGVRCLAKVVVEEVGEVVVEEIGEEVVEEIVEK